MDGERVGQVANAGAASSQPTARGPGSKNNFSGLHLDEMLSSHKPDLHRFSHELLVLPEGCLRRRSIEAEQGPGSKGHSRDEAKPSICPRSPVAKTDAKNSLIFATLASSSLSVPFTCWSYQFLDRNPIS